ncbi:MAG: HlyU family transcriptional regulator [Pseudomonadota bacterium]
MAGFFSRLFGGSAGKAAPATQPESYKDFTITPNPIQAGSEYRIAALIEKDGKSHQLIRADTLRDHEGAVEASLGKARQAIDEQGDRIFG